MITCPPAFPEKEPQAMTETRTEWRVAYERWGLESDNWEWRGTGPFIAEAVANYEAAHLSRQPRTRNVRVQQRTVTEWVDA